MAKPTKEAARSVVDEEVTRHTGCWPSQLADKRVRPFGSPVKGAPFRVLILPGKVEYDPAMQDMETWVRNLMDESGRNVIVMVTDYYVGSGTIMARRLGVDLHILNTDTLGSEDLPSLIRRDILTTSKAARRKVLTHLKSTDYVAYVSDSPDWPAMRKTLKSLEGKHGAKLLPTQVEFSARYAEFNAPNTNTVVPEDITKPTKRKKRK